MNRIEIAVAGAGVIGRRHVELIRHSDSCELAAIVDPAPAAAVLARDCAVPAYRSLAELFAARRPDAVIAATPNSLHAQNGIECARAGVPVLIEKPISDSLADAEQLIVAADPCQGARDRSAGNAWTAGGDRRKRAVLQAR
jgi:predicted dehydrogenase